MARLSFPTAFIAEYRGTEDASSFTAKESGETVQRPATLKLERQLPDGDVLPVEVPLRPHIAMGFALAELNRGELLQVIGEVNCWTGRDGRGGYFLQVHTLDRAVTNGSKQPA